VSGIEFLSAFKSPWDFVIVIAATVIGALVIMLVSKKLKGKIGFSLLHGFTVEQEQEHEKAVEERKATASNETNIYASPTWRDVAYILHRGEDIWHKINYLEMFETMRDQMNYAEERLVDVLSVVEKNFIDLLRLKLHNESAPILSLPVFRHYQVIISSTNEAILLPKFRALFRENRLAEKDETEFNHYLQNKASYILDCATHYVDNLWVPDDYLKLTREEIKDWNAEKTYPTLKIVYEDIIRNGRKISISKKEEKRRLMEEFDTFIQGRFPDTHIY